MVFKLLLELSNGQMSRQASDNLFVLKWFCNVVNTSYFKAFELIEQKGITEVPNHIKDSSRDARALGHGKGYKYPHDHPDHYLPQQYLPKELLGTYFYQPSSQGYEQAVAERLERWRATQRKALGISETEVIPDLTEDQITELKHRHRATGGKS